MLGAAAGLIVLPVGGASAGLAVGVLQCRDETDAFENSLCAMGALFLAFAGMVVGALLAIPVGFVLRMRWWWWPAAFGCMVAWGYALDLVAPTGLRALAAGDVGMPFLAAALAAPRGTSRRDRTVMAAIAPCVAVVVGLVLALV